MLRLVVGALLAVLLCTFFVSPVLAQETTSFGYDALGRVVAVARTGGPSNGATTQYQYDPADNRTNVTVSGAVVDNVSIAPTSANQGSPLIFTVTRSGNLSYAMTVQYATSDGTAVAGTNYTATSGTVTFGAGVALQTVTVPTTSNNLYASNLAMTMTLSAPSNGGALGTASATGTLVNPNAQPSLSIAPASANEGSNLVFTVTRSGDANNAITVNYATSNGSAVAGTNYTATSGTLTFAAGVTTQTITVPTTDDHVYTGSLTMAVTLSSPSSGTALVTSSATGTINNIDAQPSLSIAGASANEGSSMTFTVTRAGAPGNAVTVNYATANGSAVAGTNYTATNGTLSFAAGVTTQTITVSTTDDNVYTGALTMSINLSSPGGSATLGTASATGTINNIDAQPSLSIGSASANEGSNLTFTVTRSGAAGNAVTVNYATSNGSAIAGTNYTATSGTLTFAAGVTSQTIAVPTVGNLYTSSNPTLTAALSSPGGSAVLGNSSATGTIVINVAQPSLSIAPASANEGSNLTFTVTRSGATGNAVTVNYATANGSALAGTNYTATSGTLSFAAGVATQTITVPTTGNVYASSNPTLTVALSSPGGGAALGTSSATGTIAITAAQPSLSISNYQPSITHPASEVLTITRTGATGNAVAASFAVSINTSIGGPNNITFSPASGVVSFAPGVTTQTVTISTGGTTKNGGIVVLQAVLSSPTGGATANTTPVSFQVR